MIYAEPSHTFWRVRCTEHPEAGRRTRHRSLVLDLVLAHGSECDGPAFLLTFRDVHETRTRVWAVSQLVNGRWEHVSDQPTRTRAFSAARRYEREAVGV